jgi:hypothetical protein
MRRPIAILAVAASLAALASVAPGSPTSSTCAAAGSHRAALVVEHGDGSVLTLCVAFDPSVVTGEQLLDASGISWFGQVFGGFGAAVCAVDGEPARYSSCPGKDAYWAVFVARGGGPWQLSNAGISTLTLGDGDAEGFRYVPSSGTPAPPPLPVGTCPTAASPGATATAVAAGTAGRTATASDVATPIDSASPGHSPAAPASPGESAVAGVAGATSSAAPATTAGAAPGTDPASTPGPAPGPDLGLLAAALAGGGLGGLVLLRLTALRRPVR